MAEPGKLDDLYREVILDHYRDPRGRKRVEGATVQAEGFNPVCGDECTVALRVEGDRVGAIQVGGRGCSISVASGSILAELLPGKTLADAERLVQAFRAMMHGRETPADLDLGDLEVLAGIKDFPVRVKCALLAWTTLESGLHGHQEATTEGTADDLLTGGGGSSAGPI